jgi:transcriptional regulator with XRE-family HTH domain
MQNTNSKVREIREWSGMTQAELADEIGASVRQIKRYEKQGILPRTTAVLENLRKLAEEAEIDMDAPVKLTKHTRRAALLAPWASTLLPRAKPEKPNAERERWLWDGYQRAFLTKEQYRALGGIYDDSEPDGE